ncbi:ribonuclease H-like domain-containing protein, partial [Sparassis latifolia]
HRPGRGLPHEAVTVYTDGSCLHNGEANAQTGIGVWFGPDDPRNRALRLPGPDQSNQAGEVAAILVATQITHMAAPLHIISDSLYAIDGLTTRLPGWENRGWIDISNKHLFRAAAAALRARAAPTTFEWTKGHSTSVGNNAADSLAGQAARKTSSDTINLTIPNRFNLTGARMASLTRRLAYRGIRMYRPYLQRRAATLQLDITRHAVNVACNRLPTDATIWRSIRSPDISRPIQDFLWKCLHGALRCGHFWDNIPGYEDRAMCTNCGSLDSIDHILTECSAPGQNLIWNLCAEFWAHKHLPWYKISIGTIMGCGAIRFSAQNARHPGADRLYRILISEASYLIWKLRCERAFGRDDLPASGHTNKEIYTRWYKAISSRLTLDRTMTRKRFGKRALPPALVRNTWTGCLADEKGLPDNWLTQ